MSKAVTDAREGSLPRRLLLLSALAASFGLAADRSARAAEQTFVLRIENGRVPADMRTIRVQQGDVIKLMWSADRRSVVHLHGYDIEKTVEPGAATELSFTARAAGRYPVELHGGPRARGHEETLVTIEVYPR